ncbi:MAG: GMC family oxidoreductase [Acidimicrobiales bacterium]|nr:GMC family oxidoreductase [Acidimicrobiales bacterium]
MRPLPPITRRRFLGGSLALGAGLVAGCSSSTPRADEQRRKVIVIGTGFGGSVTALRLGEAGVDVTLIERGQRWASGQPDTFPTFAAPDHRVSWLSETNTAAGNLFPSEPWTPYTGLMERIAGDGMDVVCGAAVGGGSLPYHGMTVQPRGDLFDQVMPDELDYQEFDERWYPLVREALSATPIPDDVLASDAYAASRTFIQAVRDAGLPDAAGVPMPIDWEIVRRELAGELPPNISAGDVIYGVNGPGKHSLDTNYIPAAEATGHVDLKPLHQVDRLRRAGDGSWAVDVQRLDTDGTVVEELTMSADAVFLCAGSPNTTKLLVRAAAIGDIDDLPDDVGAWWSTNGDLLTTQFLAADTGATQGGPASIGSLDWDNPEGPVTILFAPVPWGSETHGLETVGIFIPDGHGRFSYDSATDAATLTFPESAHGAAMEAARRRVAQIGAAAGATGAIDMTAEDPSTFHPLGGAVIGKVCDAYGRVLGQTGLYVNDGALIPGSTACANPSLTIAALAERNIRQIIRTDHGTVF